MHKKAQGLSLNVIIIAILALLVLIVLAIIFVTKTGAFVKHANACENQGGRSVDFGECAGQ